jgi:hypothetical protein
LNGVIDNAEMDSNWGGRSMLNGAGEDFMDKLIQGGFERKGKWGKWGVNMQINLHAYTFGHPHQTLEHFCKSDVVGDERLTRAPHATNLSERLLGKSLPRSGCVLLEGSPQSVYPTG